MDEGRERRGAGLTQLGTRPQRVHRRMNRSHDASSASGAPVSPRQLDRVVSASPAWLWQLCVLRCDGARDFGA